MFNITSKDLEQILNFKKVLNLPNKVGDKSSGSSNKRYYRLQFGNIKFYKFLLKIGLTSRKSKTIGKLIIPDRYFADFLRGSFDGDGYVSSFWDKVYKNSYRFYMGFTSASRDHLVWIQSKTEFLFNIRGFINKGPRSYCLKFAKYESIKLTQYLFYKDNLVCLGRKRFKIEQALGIISDQQAGVL